MVALRGMHRDAVDINGLMYIFLTPSPLCVELGANLRCSAHRSHLHPHFVSTQSLPSQVLDMIESVERNPLAPLRLPIVDRWREMGTIVMGKLETGFMRVGDVFQAGGEGGRGRGACRGGRRGEEGVAWPRRVC